MIIVHHLENSRSQRVLWLLEELGVPYDIKLYRREAGTSRAPAELRSVHPLGRSPVIVDGDLTIAESGAIVEYLVETYGGGRLVPSPGTPERRRYTYFMHYAEGSMMPPLFLKLFLSRLSPGAPWPVRGIVRAVADKASATVAQPQIDTHLSFLEGELASRAWFAGPDFTAADIQMSYPLEAAVARGGLNERWPRLIDFLDRIHAMPAYGRALERGGPYAPIK